MEILKSTEVTGRQIVLSLSEPMVESDSACEDKVINSTSSVEYNTHSSSDSGTNSDDNESDSAQMQLPLQTVHQTKSGRKPGHFIPK